MDSLGMHLLARQRTEELLREAAAARLVHEALAPATASPVPGWREIALAWVPSIIERFKVGTRLELPGG